MFYGNIEYLLNENEIDRIPVTAVVVEGKVTSVQVESLKERVVQPSEADPEVNLTVVSS